MLRKNKFFVIVMFIASALVLKFIVADLWLPSGPWWVQVSIIIGIFWLGIRHIFIGTTRIIEETTDVLKDRTGLAGGFLQSFGTAFPDMIIGVVAALLSLEYRVSDPLRAINLAILAASATFGSNIYNILHATWCVWRQNLANTLKKSVLMLPRFPSLGSLTPIKMHAKKPVVAEMDAAIRILTALTGLTAFVAIAMVLFGHVGDMDGITGDLYRLVEPVGLVLFLLCLAVLYLFRKSHRAENDEPEVLAEERYYDTQTTLRIWLDLILSGIAILFAAMAMVEAMETFSHLTGMPFVITGVLAGVIGCLGEMLIVHNFSVNPNGRIADAIVGVAMDNIVTTLGASLVALLGGIFLGGSSLILIFIIILTGNTLLIEQISRLKNALPRTLHSS